MSGFVALCRLSADRARGAAGLLAIRFFGVLVAATLIAGVSLYSSAMGDAMLRASLAGDTSNQDLSIDNTSQPLSPAAYARLDRYITGQAGHDLGLPLLARHAHIYTATVPAYRLSAGRHVGRRSYMCQPSESPYSASGHVGRRLDNLCWGYRWPTRSATPPASCASAAACRPPCI